MRTSSPVRARRDGGARSQPRRSRLTASLAINTLRAAPRDQVDGRGMHRPPTRRPRAACTATWRRGRANANPGGAPNNTNRGRGLPTSSTIATAMKRRIGTGPLQDKDPTTPRRKFSEVYAYGAR